MPRYKLLVEYDGTDYHGWQRQPNANTVEEELEKGITRILGEPVDIKGQGRTDSGVHAEAQAAHFDSEQPIDRSGFLYAMPGVLPRDISVWDLQQVQDDFHARFDAKSRQYRYQMITRPSPLADRFAKRVSRDLNPDVMNKCAEMIADTHDFRNFCKISDQRESTVCNVEHSVFMREGHRLTYRIRANRFKHHMVRRLVGTMLQAGLGKMPLSHFRKMLDEPENEHRSHGIAAKGLVLEQVRY
jgi:tRNA pseudouridine38-40 synthase